MKPRDFRNILIVRLTALGDVVHTFPAIKALRKKFPNAKVTYIVEQIAGSLLVGMAEVDDTIIFNRLSWSNTFKSKDHFKRSVDEIWRVLWDVRRRRFDLVIDFQGNLRSGIVTWFTGAPVRIGFSPKHSREYHSFFYTRFVPVSDNRLNKVKKDFHLLEPLGITGMDGTCTITVSLGEKKPIDDFFDESVPSGKKIVLMHPGVSVFGSFKAWPVKSWIGLCEILEKRDDIVSVISWGPGEEPLAEEIAGSINSPTTVMAPDTVNLKKFVHLVRRSDVFVGADSGPLHLAASVGIPVVGLYGPKDPVIYGPFSDCAEIVRAGVHCQPCWKRRCEDPICMTRMTPESVAEACLRLLKG